MSELGSRDQWRFLTAWQFIAFRDPVFIGEECVNPKYGHKLKDGSLVLTINRGYE